MSSAFKQTDILLVNANSNSLAQTESSLKEINPNYEIRTATGRDEAISFLHESVDTNPNVVIIDTADPSELGFKIIEEIRNSGDLKTIKTLLVSDHYDEAIIAKCSELDVDILRKSTAEGEFIEQLRAKINKLRRQV